MLHVGAARSTVAAHSFPGRVIIRGERAPTGPPPRMTPPTPEPAATPLPAESIGRYRLLRRADGGAGGVVYEALEPASGLRVALKLMHPQPADASLARHFEAEVRALRALEHPDIVRLLDAGTWHGHPWLAMEWLPGHDLSRHTSPPRLLSVPEVVEIGRRVAAALAHAHEHGVLHRDIKPSNVRVHLPAGMVKLADFGLARFAGAEATKTGVVPGTPAYMAPEHLRGAMPDESCDVYALGATLFQLLAGRLPHEAGSMGELLRRVATEPAPHVCLCRPDAPQPLGDLLDRMLQRSRAKRIASAREVAETLAAIAPARATR